MYLDRNEVGVCTWEGLTEFASYCFIFLSEIGNKFISRFRENI